MATCTSRIITHHSPKQFGPQDSPAFRIIISIGPLQLARQGITAIEFEELDTNWEGEAYISVSGQNSNNSIRVSDEFMVASEKNSDWNLIRRTDGEIADSVSSKELLESDWICRVGVAQTLAFNLTQPSTTGTRAPPMVASTALIPAQNTCSWMIPHAI